MVLCVCTCPPWVCVGVVVACSFVVVVVACRVVGLCVVRGAGVGGGGVVVGGGVASASVGDVPGRRW